MLIKTDVLPLSKTATHYTFCQLHKYSLQDLTNTAAMCNSNELNSATTTTTGHEQEYNVTLI